MQSVSFIWINFFALLLVPLCGSSQSDKNEDHSSFAGIRFGILVSNNGLYDESKAESPQVSGGLSMALEGAWLAHRNMGIGGSVQYLQGAVKQPDPLHSIPGKVVFPDTLRWNAFSLGAGPYFSFPFQNFSLETKLYPGFTSLRAYNKTITTTVFGPDPEQRISLDAKAFSLQSGFTFRLDLRPGLSVALIYDHLMFIGTHPTTYIQPGNPSTISHSSHKQLYHVPTLNLAFVVNIPHYISD